MATDSQGSHDHSPRRLFDALADECACHILATLARRPRSPSELVEQCDKSAATVYRRLRTLTELDLIRQRPLCEGDGRQRAYVLAVGEISVRLDEAGIDVAVTGSNGEVLGDSPRDDRELEVRCDS